MNANKNVVQQLGGGGGGGDVANLSLFGRGRHDNDPFRERTHLTNPLVKYVELGASLWPCRGSYSPIPGRDCFDDHPGDGIIVSPPPQPLNDSKIKDGQNGTT